MTPLIMKLTSMTESRIGDGSHETPTSLLNISSKSLSALNRSHERKRLEKRTPEQSADFSKSKKKKIASENDSHDLTPIIRGGSRVVRKSLQEGENTMEPLTKWEEKSTDKKGDTTVIEMWHLHFGVSVPLRSWKKAIRAKTPTKFLRELILHLWKENKLIYKTLDVVRTDEAQNREPITPKKWTALKSTEVTYNFYCIQSILKKMLIPMVKIKKEEKESKGTIGT
uniref:Uncharacterized protein n=1 Tax=Trichogramma kaykai TaxID=54128 RepID=A0ABD2X076_9HYME